MSMGVLQNIVAAHPKGANYWTEFTGDTGTVSAATILKLSRKNVWGAELDKNASKNIFLCVS